jgi:hypothetical protein
MLGICVLYAKINKIHIIFEETSYKVERERRVYNVRKNVTKERVRSADRIVSES